MPIWKKVLVDHLINTTKSVNVMLRNKNVRQLIQIPKELDNIDDINKLSKDLNNAIKFPYLCYLPKEHHH